MTTTYKIKDFDTIIKIGTTFQQNWFRGHSKVFNELTPGIFRPRYNNGLHNTFRPNLEQEFAEEFKRKAPSLVSNLPETNNHLEWLFLMQHHGVPTRLLDWSENILVATFFIVCDNVTSDGELWSMHPWKLNDNLGFWGYPVIDKSRELNFLASEIFHTNPEGLRQDLNLKTNPSSPLAFLPPLKHPRMTSQQSAFTIHPRGDNAKTIIDTITDEKFLTRYIIPKELKRRFRNNLTALGVDYKNIFPDLEGLAKTIVENGKGIAWSQPDPLDLEKFE